MANYFRVGNNGILISDDTNPLNYKLVCYEGDSSEPLVTAVYKLENYDYNIHNKQFKLTTLLEILKRSDDNEKHARSILENNRSVYGTIFKKYSTKSCRFNDLTRKHNRNLQDVGIKSNGAGVYQDVGQELSAGVKEKFSLDEDYDFTDEKAGAIHDTLKYSMDENNSEWLVNDDGKNNINDLIKEAVALETTGKIGFYYLDKKEPRIFLRSQGTNYPANLKVRVPMSLYALLMIMSIKNQ